MQNKYLSEFIDTAGIVNAKGCIIEKVLLTKKDDAVFYLLSESAFCSHDIDEIINRIYEKYHFFKQIKIIQNIAEKMKLDTYIKYNQRKIIKYLADENTSSALFLSENWYVKENTVHISALSKSHLKMLGEQQIEQKIRSYIKRDAALDALIHFEIMQVDDNDTEVNKSAIDKNVNNKSIPQQKRKKIVHTSNNKISQKNAGRIIGELIYGRVNKHKIQSLDNVYLKQTGEMIAACGKCFYAEVVENRLRSYIRVYINDEQSSAEIRINCDKSEIEDLFDKIKKTRYAQIFGKIAFDEYKNDRYIQCYGFLKAEVDEYTDKSKQKRVELHCHSQYSERDAVSKIEDIFYKLSKMGHQAVAITDHAGVYAYPDAFALSKKYGIKVIYGVEAYMVDDENFVLNQQTEAPLDSEIIVVDVETTGLCARNDEIIELAAVKIKNFKIIDTYSALVKPKKPVPQRITALTSITQQMLNNADDLQKVMEEFICFVKDTQVLCTHNTSFDSAFIDKALRQTGHDERFVYLDSLHLCRRVFTQLKTYKLKSVTKLLNIDIGHAHRALDDAVATAKVLLHILSTAKSDKISMISELKEYRKSPQSDKKAPHIHCTILVKNKQGLKDLYKLISNSNLKYFYRRPKILKSEIALYKKNFMIGSACDSGEVFQAFINARNEQYMLRLANFYDYLEIQPIGNSMHLVNNGILSSKEDIIQINKDIISLAEKTGKYYVATGDVHFVDEKDSIYRAVLLNALKFDDADNQAPLYLRNTSQMLDEFYYLEQEKAYKAVVENTQAIASFIEDAIRPIPEGSYPPVMEGAEKMVAEYIYKTAHEKYGDILPELIEKSIEKEISVIAKYNYSVLYYLAQKVVHKAKDDGYLVGSRGSVGSSLAATFLGITEVNPLPPHYVCPVCKHTEFADVTMYGVGADLPDKNCPHCNCAYEKDGFDIPFECFLGFEGDKEPDIDLNFASDYQGKIHKYVEEMLGVENVFRSGTISKVAGSLARNYAKKYLDDRGLVMNSAEQKRLEIGCSDVKSTTGQHPGGLIILPQGMEIYEFTPVQYPANDENKKVITTSFDYDALKGRLLKLDLLGHDDPSMINALQKLTGYDVKKIKFDDKTVLSLFTSLEALNLKDTDILTEVGTYGVPEFGTKFVREMLKQAQPQCFDDLIRISGLSHGTDVWINNAAEYIKNGTATIKNVISTRDSIMLYLIQMGMESKTAFDIMERVRKGKGLKDSDIEKMKQINIDDWYIDSCNKIKYMFPKAHAAAYVMMGFRVAYYKIYYPLEYYSAYFSIRSKDFDLKTILKGPDAIRKEIKKYYSLKSMTQTQKDTLITLEIALEMICRGYEFETITLGKSHYNDFIIADNKLVLPYKVIEGAGEKVTKKIYEQSKIAPFTSIEDLKKRTSASIAVLDELFELKALEGLQKTDQFAFF
jgi:DNA polymerase-3 subunit alpha (Gram-positive type)